MYLLGRRADPEPLANRQHVARWRGLWLGREGTQPAANRIELIEIIAFLFATQGVCSIQL